MAEEEGQPKPLSRAERSVEIRVAARLENLAVVRTLVAAIAASEALASDAAADLRPAADEACTALIRAAVPESSLQLTVDPGDETVVITASTTCTGAAVVEPGSFSWHVLSSLTDEVKTFTDGDGPDTGQVFGITLMTRRASLLR